MPEKLTPFAALAQGLVSSSHPDYPWVLEAILTLHDFTQQNYESLDTLFNDIWDILNEKERLSPDALEVPLAISCLLAYFIPTPFFSHFPEDKQNQIFSYIFSALSKFNTPTLGFAAVAAKKTVFIFPRFEKAADKRALDAYIRSLILLAGCKTTHTRGRKIKPTAYFVTTRALFALKQIINRRSSARVLQSMYTFGLLGTLFSIYDTYQNGVHKKEGGKIVNQAFEVLVCFSEKDTRFREASLCLSWSSFLFYCPPVKSSLYLDFLIKRHIFSLNLGGDIVTKIKIVDSLNDLLKNKGVQKRFSQLGGLSYLYASVFPSGSKNLSKLCEVRMIYLLQTLTYPLQKYRDLQVWALKELCKLVDKQPVLTKTLCEEDGLGEIQQFCNLLKNTETSERKRLVEELIHKIHNKQVQYPHPLLSKVQKNRFFLNAQCGLSAAERNYAKAANML